MTARERAAFTLYVTNGGCEFEWEFDEVLRGFWLAQVDTVMQCFRQ